jgi:iron(III) transport system ATP-binding protein
MSGIRVADLYHCYPTRGTPVPAVDSITFDVSEGEFFTLLGPSGCGKTTTLRCIAGLERPQSGEISLGDVVVVSSRKFVPTHLRDIGMVFQDYAVWPHMSVFENVAFPLKVSRTRYGKDEIRNKVENILRLVNMEAFIDRRGTQLSGGQQQRLSLARALVREPKVLLLDEPLSNLDALLREQMRAELRLLQRSVKVTTLFVTHDQVEALSLSNRIAVMNKGKIVQLGKPREIYFTPNSEFVAGFVGAKGFVHGVVESSDESSTRVQTPMGGLRCLGTRQIAIGMPVVVTIRPEAARLSQEDPDLENTFRAVVELALFNGESVEYRVRLEDQLLRVKGDSRTNFRIGDTVFLTLPPHECVIVSDMFGEGESSAIDPADAWIDPREADLVASEPSR